MEGGCGVMEKNGRPEFSFTGRDATADAVTSRLFSVTVSVITISATAERNEAKVTDEKEIRKLKKREAILLDGLSESPYVHSPPVKVVYRKASRTRYGKPKSKYGVTKSKHGPPKISGPQKKYKRKPTSKYVPRAAYKRPKTRNGPTKSTHSKRKPYYSPTKTFEEEIYIPSESTGFAEPPINYIQTPKIKTYGEPPTDAYNAPLINTYHQYPIGQEFSHDQTQQNYYTGPDHPFSSGVSAPTQWQPDYTPNQSFSHDNNYEDSHNQQFYTTVNEARPIEDVVLDGQTVNDDYVEQTELFNPKPTASTYPRRNLKRKPYTFRSKKASRPQFGDKIIVGGKYAEPPARYVPKFQSSVPTYSDSFSANNWMDSEMAGTAGSAVSSYVNYKNSNLAFSPQNLNDVFSIVD